MPSTNSALEAACRSIAASTGALRARLTAAACPAALRIVANNPRRRLGYGMAGGFQMFADLDAPSPSDLKRMAAEAIIAHRKMWAAGGRSSEWIDRATRYRRAAFAAMQGAAAAVEADAMRQAAE